MSNLRIAHKSCNLWKGDRLPLKDGTIPERPVSNIKKKKIKKNNRPKMCNACMSGRMLGRDQICRVCNSSPQPTDFPGWAKRNTKDCDHNQYHCFACILGFVKRKI